MDFRIIKQKHRTVANYSIWSFILGVIFGCLEFYFDFEYNGMQPFGILFVGLIYLTGIPLALVSVMEDDYYKRER